MKTRSERGRGSTPGPLANIPLFAGLPAEGQTALLSLMKEESVAVNQTVCWYGETADCLFLIIEGEVSVSVPSDNGDHVVINQLRSGDFFGEIGLLDGGPRVATVRADTPLRVLKLDRTVFHLFLTEHPSTAVEMITAMGRRLRETSDAIKEMKNANVVFDTTHTGPWQRACDIIATVAASPPFTLFHLFLFIVWILWNVVLRSPMAFDPYPFGLLTVIVSLEAIFLSIFVMVSQSRQSEKDRLRTDLDYQINVKAQTEVMEISRRLEAIESYLGRRVESGSTAAPS